MNRLHLSCGEFFFLFCVKCLFRLRKPTNLHYHRVFPDSSRKTLPKASQKHASTMIPVLGLGRNGNCFANWYFNFRKQAFLRTFVRFSMPGRDISQMNSEFFMKASIHNHRKEFSTKHGKTNESRVFDFLFARLHSGLQCLWNIFRGRWNSNNRK